MKLKDVLISCAGTALAFLAIALSASSANAGLGGASDSVEKDRQALGAATTATSVRANYTVQEIRSDANTVREYVSATGIVFGVAWVGAMHPDLTPLLGSYAAEYETAARTRIQKSGHSRSLVQGSRVVVGKWGHMRKLQGRAYDPALIPSGVSVDEIQ